MGAFPGLPPKGLEQWFRVKVLSEGLEEGFRIRVQRTREIPFGRLLWAFRKSAQFGVTNAISEPILTNPFRPFTWKFRAQQESS